MKRVPIIDNGHGGMINGKYVTPGKRGTVNGETIYEGVYNRRIAREVMRKLDQMGIPYFYLHGGDDDLSLSKRVAKANAIYKKNPNTYGVSIHLNASKEHLASGWEVWTSKGQTKSDEIATVFFDEAKRNLPNEKMRSDFYRDGDADKESQFYILSKTDGPFILTENLFMDNEGDFNKLQSPTTFNKIVMLHVKAIMRLWNGELK